MRFLDWILPKHRAAELNTDDACRDEIAGLCDGLRGDELVVIRHICDRIAMGQKQYGVLSIAGDRRDWDREALEEICDLAVYAAIRVITQGKR